MLDGLDRDPLASFGGDLERGQGPAGVPGRPVATTIYCDPISRATTFVRRTPVSEMEMDALAVRPTETASTLHMKRPWPTAIVLVWFSVCEE